MEGMTASEAAGLGVGALLFLATIAAPKVDAFIASSQRRGMCKRCSDLKIIPCSTCGGQGVVLAESFRMVNEILGPLGITAPFSGSKPCRACSAKGHMPCPNCSGEA